MPGGDRTGPLGLGPMTGRRAGFCAGFGMPGYMNPAGRGGFGGGWGMGRGWGFGRGRGWGRGRWSGFGMMGYGYPAAGAYPVWTGWESAPGAWAAPNPTQEMDMLRAEAKHMESTLEAIRKRIDDLAAETGESER